MNHNAAQTRLRWSDGVGYPKNDELLFVSLGSGIAVYSRVRSLAFNQVATITTGVSGPGQLAFDSDDTLYVPNASGSISEYPNGSLTPSKTITTGLSNPVGAAVDANDTLYVSNNGDVSSILEFPKGSSAPSVTITSPLFGLLEGEAIDASGNLYVASNGGAAGTNQVYEIPAGSTVPQSLGLDNLNYCEAWGGDDYEQILGLGFDKEGTLLVSCPNGNALFLYKLPAQEPFATLAVGNMNGPAFFSFDPSGRMYVANNAWVNIEVLSRGGFQVLGYVNDLAAANGAFLRARRK